MLIYILYLNEFIILNKYNTKLIIFLYEIIYYIKTLHTANK